MKDSQANFLSEIKIARIPSKFDRILSLLKYLITGKNFDLFPKEESLFRYICRKPIPYKTICKIIQLSSKEYIKNPQVLCTDDQHLKRVIDYTLKVTNANKATGSVRRMQPYYQLIQTFSDKPLCDSDLLVVGPRMPIELFLAWTYGFKWKKIRAIDLISYHPKIELMDVDSMSIESNSLDCIVMANVWGYNNNPEACMTGLSKVLRKKGLLAFNSSTSKPPIAPETHRSGLFTRDQLKDLLSSRNLNVISCQKTEETATHISYTWIVQKDSDY